MSLLKKLQLFAFAVCIYTSHTVASQDAQTPLIIDTIASGLGIPWGMSILPDNSMLISQREGILSKLDLTTGQLHSISGLPEIKVKGQGGLFDVRIPPDYAATGWIYFTYSKDVAGHGATTLSRAKMHGSKLSEWQDLLITQSSTNTNYHFGGRISFDHNGHVFLTIGDRGVRSNAQDLSNHAGSILRLNLDGTVPDDNPYTNDTHALNEIWSHGHRNPQGLFFNTQTKQLWAIEHGPRGGDEINLIHSGFNYGWPVISKGREYHRDIPVGQSAAIAGMEHPIKTYVPSIAPSGFIQYSGNAIPAWSNNLLTGSLKLRHLNRIELDDQNNAITEHRLLRSIKGRIRNIVEDQNGWLYVSTDDGRIVSIKPKP